MIGIGSLRREGGWGVARGVPVLVKAPDAWINLARAVMPFVVPRIVGRDMWEDAFSSM